MINLRNKMLEAMYKHADGHIAKHKINIEVYLNNPVGVGEHPDLIEAIETELEQIAKYEDQIAILSKYFPVDKEVI
jgi:hypothetical protein